MTHTHTCTTGPSTCGVVYTRWVRTTCPNTYGTQLLYAGRAAGSHYTDRGGGANYLCLPEQPQYSNYTPGVQTGRAYLYGLSIRLEVLTHKTLDRSLLVITMSHVQCANHQHEQLLWWFLHNILAHHPGPESILDISWEICIIIVEWHLNVWTNLPSQYQAA